jgi:ribonuclease P protein subunit RPR2
MDAELVTAQALRYADELSILHSQEEVQRQRVEQALVELSISCGATVRALAMALELRDDATGEHAQRVTALAVDIAERIAPDLITDPQLEYGYLLHDVGKIGIPDAILLKPGHLTAAERRTMQEHTRLGGQIVSSVPQLDGLAREIVASHHERWDGKGYPLGLGGEGIPVAA